MKCPYCNKKIETVKIPPIEQLLNHVGNSLNNYSKRLERWMRVDPKTRSLETYHSKSNIEKWQLWYDTLKELIEKNESNP